MSIQKNCSAGKTNLQLEVGEEGKPRKKGYHKGLEKRLSLTQIPNAPPVALSLHIQKESEVKQKGIKSME